MIYFNLIRFGFRLTNISISLCENSELANRTDLFHRDMYYAIELKATFFLPTIKKQITYTGNVTLLSWRRELSSLE